MRALIIQILTLSLVYNCGKLPMLEKKKEKAYNVEPKYESYMISFEKDAKRHGLKLNLNNIEVVSVDTLGDRILGTCTKYSGDIYPPKIRISTYYWSQLSEESREQLMYHELGHCILGRPHLDASQVNGIPYSVMNTYHLGTVYSANREHYIYELFTRKYLASALPLTWYKNVASTMSEEKFGIHSAKTTLDDLRGTQDEVLSDGELMHFECDHDFIIHE